MDPAPFQCRRRIERGVVLRLALLLALALEGASAAGEAGPGDAVLLQLKWRHQFQFAGYYVAADRGFYAAQNLAVTIREGGPAHPPLRTVLTGEAQYGVTGSDVLEAKLSGEPVVVLATIFQHSPYALLTRRDRALVRPADLVGQRVMLDDGQGATEFRAMMLREGLGLGDAKLIPHTWNNDDLVEGRADAMSGYVSVEPFQLRARGVEVAIIRPVDYGIDFYGDSLFTTAAEVEKHPARAAAMRRASLEGWEWALDHVEETVAIILALPGVQERGITAEHLRYEAEQMRALILPKLIELGHTNRGRWERMAETYASLGLLAHGSLDGFFYEDRAAGRELRAALGVAGGLALIGAMILLWNWQLRRQVRRRTEDLVESQGELRDQHRVLQSILDSMGESVVVVDRNGQIMLINPAARRLLGAEISDVPFAQWRATREFYLPDGITPFPAEAMPPRRALQGEATDSVEGILKDTQTGATIALSASARPIVADGERFGAVVVLRDITERQRVAAELQAKEARYRLLFAGSPQPMWLYDRDTLAIVEVNDAAIARYGYTREEFLAMTIAGVRPPEALAEMEHELKSRRPGIRRSGPWPHRTKAGEKLLVEVASGDLEIEDRRLRLALMTDVTERHQLEAARANAEQEIRRLNADLERRVGERTAQLENANRELESFSYSVSHDLRAPLRHLEGFSRVLLEDHLDQLDEAGRKCVDRIVRAAAQMTELTEALLALSRVSRSELSWRKVDLTALARAVADDLQRDHAERHVDWRIADDVTAFCDPRLMRQALHNLLENAYKYTARRDQAHIEFGAEGVAGNGAVYYVRDDGVGFDMNHADRLFRAFQRLHDAADFEGTGIGLATVQRIVHRHGGRIWAESAKDSGSVFYFTLGPAPAA